MRGLARVIVLVFAAIAAAGCAETSETTGPAITAQPSPSPDPSPAPEPTPAALPSRAAVPTATVVPPLTATPAPTATAAPPLPAATATAQPTSTLAPTVEPGDPVDAADDGAAGEGATDEGAAGEGAEGDEGDDGDGGGFREPDDLPPSDYTGEVRAIRTSRGLMLPVRAATDGSYLVVTPCYNLATVTGGLGVGGALDILLDPGHGGEESGAVGPNGLKESTVNLQVAELLRAELLDRGYTVELTRYGDERVAIQSRAELANALQPTVFMSIHHNGGFPEPFPVAGTEVFVQLDDPESRRLGGLVFEELQDVFAGIDAAWMGNPETFGVAWRQNDEGTDLYGVLRRTPDLVSVLTEAMFISTAAEAELLAQPAILEREALALADALDRWFDTSDPGSGFVDGVIFQGDLGNGGGTQGCVDPPLD